jgi:hypothetical protein
MRLFRKPAYLAGALLGLGLLFGGNPALADVRATFMGTSPGPNGCTYYNYDCFATGGGILKGGLGAAPTQGNFFTFYDFNGFTGVADVIAPAGFVTLAQNTGFTPANTNPVDLPGITNITFVNNTGVNFDGSVVDTFIGTFSICSTSCSSRICSHSNRGGSSRRTTLR